MIDQYDVGFIICGLLLGIVLFAGIVLFVAERKARQ